MRCIHIHPDDNIAIVTGDVIVGDKLEYDDSVVVATGEVPRFNKIALENIAEGSEVRRYGLPIGIATRNILQGECVHVHNVRSAWIPTFATRHEPAERDEGSRHER
jgi:altronate hydrolase